MFIKHAKKKLNKKNENISFFCEMKSKLISFSYFTHLRVYNRYIILIINVINQDSKNANSAPYILNHSIATIIHITNFNNGPIAFSKDKNKNFFIHLRKDTVHDSNKDIIKVIHIKSI